VRGAAVIGAAVAAITAVITLRFLTRYFRHRNLIPFGLYCIGFGAFMTVFTAVAGAPETDGPTPRGGGP
jgi:undecaprenyl-diphosphatase